MCGKSNDIVKAITAANTEAAVRQIVEPDRRDVTLPCQPGYPVFYWRYMNIKRNDNQYLTKQKENPTDIDIELKNEDGKIYIHSKKPFLVCIRGNTFYETRLQIYGFKSIKDDLKL